LEFVHLCLFVVVRSDNWKVTLTHHIDSIILLEDDTISENHEEGKNDFHEVDHGYDDIK
jgi:hypothetical protein